MDASGVPAPKPALLAGATAEEAGVPLRKSLRGKGMAATLALLAYVLAAGWYVASERGKIVETVAALDRLARHEKAMALAEAAVDGALLDIHVAGNGQTAGPVSPAEHALHLESVARLLTALDEFDAGYALLQRAIQRSHDALLATPPRASWDELRAVLGRSADELEIRRRRLAEERHVLTRDFQRQFDAVTVKSMLLAGVGLATFGSLTGWFFGRLAGDIRRLESHARQIVQGRRGVALPVHRDDELGHLMRAVNRMATDLDEREKQIELDSQRRAYQDKMLSVGALAAGVAHEVNNPLAAITGAAQALRDSDGAPTAQLIDESTQLILAQAQRAARAARQLAEVAAPEGAEADLVDLGALLRRVLQLNGYDRRYRQLRFTILFDPELPAVRTVGSALRQVLMQVLTVACDALVAAGQHDATITLATAAIGAEVTVQITLAPVLDFNRPELQRALLICRALIEPQGGRLAFGQDASGLLRIQLSLPAETGDEPG